MNHDSIIWKDGQLPLIGGLACPATSKESGCSFHACHNSLCFTIQAAVKKSDAEGIFLNKYLEIRENRVNTHTHTHTGFARQYTANHLIHKGLAAVFLQLSDLLVRENHIMHTVSPPARCRMAETFIYPRNRATHVNAVPAGFRGFLYPIRNK